MRSFLRGFAVVSALLASVWAMAGTITVSEPNSGDFLGKSNRVSFNITGASAVVTVTVTARLVSDPSVSIQVRTEVTPDGDGRASGNVSLNFAETQPNGLYDITVVATEPGGTYNTVPTITVTVDTIDPKFLNFNPIANTFTRNTVMITADFDEANIDEWRVRVDGNDIPNNTGSTGSLTVPWDVNGFANDGNHTIEISIEDLAGNRSTRSISMTLDRVAPSTAILAPIGSVNYRPNSLLPVVVRITDQFSNSVDSESVRVEIQDMTGGFLGYVARIGDTSSGNSMTWTGRVRNGTDLPSQFKIVVNVRDKAGNQAVAQEVTVSTDRGITDEEVQALKDGLNSETVMGIGRWVRSKALINRLHSKGGGGKLGGYKNQGSSKGK